MNTYENKLKLYGSPTTYTTADGASLGGRWCVCEAGDVLPSHDPLNGFAVTIGFPADEAGRTVNDRDYEHDADAQHITRDIAAHYDARAIQNPVIVDPSGVVLSGNGRTMAGMLAARDNTDGAYISHLRDHCGQFGITIDDLDYMSYAHPRLIIELDDALPYTAATFARFNAVEMKSMSKTEKAVKLGKMIDDETFKRIIAIISAHDSIAAVYADNNAACDLLKELLSCGVISQMSWAEMYDGGQVSAIGRELVETALIGKAFAADQDAVRRMTAIPSTRQSVVTALGEICVNMSLCESYTLSHELCAAVNLVFDARTTGGYQAGDVVSSYSQQGDIFSGMSNYSDSALFLADALNDKRATLVRRIYTLYDNEAIDASFGQMDLLGAPRTKAEILADVITSLGGHVSSCANSQSQQGGPNFESQPVQDEKTMSARESAAAEKKACEKRIIRASAPMIASGRYAELAPGCIVRVEKLNRYTATVSFGDGGGFDVNRLGLRPCNATEICLPDWISVGTIITDGSTLDCTVIKQRINDVRDGFVYLDYINGGYFEVSIPNLITNFRPCA